MHSNLVFPALKGLGWPIKKTPHWNTLSVSPLSARGAVDIPLQAFATYDFDLPFNYLRGSEAAISSDYYQLLDFYNAMQGSAISFNYLDPNDNTATNSYFAFGDGVSTVFQLIKTRTLSRDLVQSLNGTPALFGNGNPLLSSSYNLSPTGVVTFYAPPASGVLLSWTGAFYYVVHFAEDTLDQLELLMGGLWDLASCKLQTRILP